MDTSQHINLATLAKFQDAWIRKDITALLECVTPDFVYRASVGTEPGTTYTGIEQVREGVRRMWDVDSGSVPSIDDVTAVGEGGHRVRQAQRLRADQVGRPAFER